MSVERKKIIVGSQYKATFDSLLKILGSGKLSGTGARVEDGASGKTIVTDTTEYIYDASAGSGASGSGATISMDKSGASWFAPVRKGQSFDDGTSEWKQLIYRVARDFHDEFSIIEYKQCDGSGESDSREAEQNVGKIIDRFFGVNNAAVFKGSDASKGTEDIYGASVKLELSATGQSHFVVMCKIYFRKNGNGVFPLTGSAARQINSRLEESVDNDEPIQLTLDESANINTVTVNAVRELVAGNYPVSFKDSLCFSTKQKADPVTGVRGDNYDLKTFKQLVKRANVNKAPLVCTSIQVLGISHVRWINDYYEIAFGGKVVMQAIVGFGGSITLRCLNCNGGDLITSDSISYVTSGKRGAKNKEHVVLDYSTPDLGIDDKTFKDILLNSEFKNHLISVKCGNNSRTGKQCSSLVCRSQTVEVGGEMKCANCPYPEMVYTDYSGDRPLRYLTGQMTFVNDKLAMALKSNTGNCRKCGRAFTTEALDNGLCNICKKIDHLSGAEAERAKKLYKKYSGAFSYGVRLRHLSDKKYCLEDDTALVFAMGRKTYVLCKLDMFEDGFIKRPKWTK